MTHTPAGDMLEDSFPHGTKEGFNLGCRGGGCPTGEAHGLSCRRAQILSAGNFQYQRMVRAGSTPAEIADALGLNPVIDGDPKPRKPLPVEPVETPRKWSVRRVWVAVAPDGALRGAFDEQGAAFEFIRSQLTPAPAPELTKPKRAVRPMTDEEAATVRELNAQGVSDSEIARRLGRKQPVISAWRRRMGIDPVPRS